MIEEPQQYCKLIKFFKVEGLNLDETLNTFKKGLEKFIHWNIIEPELETQNIFMVFPNESIYNSGIILSKHRNFYHFQLIKNKKELYIENSISYEFLPSVVYTDPVNLFKKQGYSITRKSHSDVSVYKSLEYGVEVRIYNNAKKDEEYLTYPYIEVVETGGGYVTKENFMWKEIYDRFKDVLIQIQNKDINIAQMTVKGEALIRKKKNDII